MLNLNRNTYERMLKDIKEIEYYNPSLSESFLIARELVDDFTLSPTQIRKATKKFGKDFPLNNKYIPIMYFNALIQKSFDEGNNGFRFEGRSFKIPQKFIGALLEGKSFRDLAMRVYGKTGEKIGYYSKGVGFILEDMCGEDAFHGCEKCFVLAIKGLEDEVQDFGYCAKNSEFVILNSKCSYGLEVGRESKMCSFISNRTNFLDCALAGKQDRIYITSPTGNLPWDNDRSEFWNE